MASTSAVTGLVTGLDTKTIISQLMSIARAPQDELKTSLSKTNSQVTAAQAINSKAASMTSLAADLASAKTFTTASARSSDSSVSATASSSATPGSITFTVKQLATAHVVLSDAIPSGSSSPAISIGSASYAADTVSALADSINKDKDAKVTATVVNDGTSQRLQLTAKDTGSDNTFGVSGTGFTDSNGDDVSTVVKQGQNAQITMGDPSAGSGAVTISSSTNTFTGLMAGVDVTVSAKDKTVTVSTSVDQSAISSKIATLVTAMNNVLGDIQFHTKALATGQTASSTSGGLLRGNSTLRDLAGQLVGSVTVNATTTSAGGTTTGVNATQAGFSAQRDGTVTFDAAAFSKLYAKDPAQAAAVVQKFADTVQSIGKLASDPVSGSVTGYVNGGQTTAKTMTQSIADWDDRLASKQKRLESQYAALEVALGKLSDQGNSLTAALKQFENN
ncbi:hypothetical protein FHN55_03445 [Streptomyces sp. NP160]|uniref:flagellar filament capping protein FliD n=1 Tax=Streptomyces sp. NP160 TaxID=2586637 RepID=UPI001117FB97|nr:flagellar filament capping protein FliD [Streptomyces sp. NP160]TNM69381.1 hypothetical protein FHN55_03445 [Streptomyces sp. NP160]